jgi:hypothetical protein
VTKIKANETVKRNKEMQREWMREEWIQEGQMLATYITAILGVEVCFSCSVPLPLNG